MVSRLGQIKRSPLKEFEVTRYSKPIKCFKLGANDYMVDASFTSGNHDVLLVNTSGDASLFNENDIPLVSLRAGGVKAMTSTKDKAEIAGMVLYPQGEYSRIAILSNNHASRIVDIKNMLRTARLGMKTSLFKTFKSDPQQVACLLPIAKGEKTFKMTALLKNSSTVAIEFADTKPSPYDSYLKKNLTIGLPFPIIDCFKYDVPTVDNSIKVITIVKPVVVKPETVSKNASKNDKLSPIINGIQPIKLIRNHDTVTIQKPSLAYKFLFLDFKLFKIIPAIILIDVGIRNGVIDSL